MNCYENYIQYRKIDGHGWLIVGRASAAEHYAEFYVKSTGVSCRRRHHAPIYVENNRCLKCVELGYHDVPIGDFLTIDTDPDKPVDIERIQDFWRKKLDLEDYDHSLSDRMHHSIYVIDGVAYFSLKQIREDLKIAGGTLNNRCASTKYVFANYVRIKVPGAPQRQTYIINGKAFTRQQDICDEYGLHQAIVSQRCSSPEWTTWEVHYNDC